MTAAAVLVIVAAAAVPLLVRAADQQARIATRPPTSTTVLPSRRCSPTDTAACAPKPKPSSVLPGPTAPPEMTVSLYLAALNAHNRALAEQLLEPSFRKQVEKEQLSMLTNVASITNVKITRSLFGADGVDIPAGYQEAATISVTFDLRQNRVGPMSDGSTPWGYTLVRRNRSSRWLIANEGLD